LDVGFIFGEAIQSSIFWDGREIEGNFFDVG
jgi:hypothetical protein